ncbi:hypothetical protein [Streptomyces deccanensis]|nr:hypothetical protein [Streptomyces deccanensis]ULR48326.1 hypothetical protein L3078_02965 [Streptomyces deccanensis]
MARNHDDDRRQITNLQFRSHHSRFDGAAQQPFKGGQVVAHTLHVGNNLY